MKILQGAEAEVEIKENSVLKRRPRKNYRHESIDSRLREERTETEVKLMKEARKHGVKVPEIKGSSESRIEMDRIKGNMLKQVLENDIEKIEKLGENIALLHDIDIVHGDLTTSNALVDGKVYLIDFGLSYRSQRVEDKAVDIHLLKQVLNSSHPEVADKAWESFIEGYNSYEESDKVLEQLKDVESRGRYK